MDLFSGLLISVIIFVISYWYFSRTHNTWTKQNVPSVPDPLPGVGHMLWVLLFKENLNALIMKWYNSTRSSVIGFHFLQTPGLIVRDPELVKNILQTNFASFSCNFLHINEKVDPIMSKNPFFVRDVEKWKKYRVRAISHLSGKKLSYLFIIIQEVSSKLSAYTERKINENNGVSECELKEFFIKYTGEVVANCAFGIEGQSFQDNPDRLSFTRVAKTLFEPTFLNGIKQSLIFFVPSVGDFFQFKFTPTKADNYFRENLSVIIKQRKQANVAPNDFLQFALESNPEIDIDSVAADMVIFYADVYETSSTVLTFLFYHLSKNKNIQEKLRKHIVSTLQANGGVLTYEILKNMNYLEQAILESIRLTPPFGSLMKECTQDITLEGSDGLKCQVRAGTPVFIPIASLHNDPQYWPNPEVYDPERFSAENQSNNTKYAFLPFGDGPRMCVGMRLALIIMKLAAITLLTKFSLEPSTKNQLPFQLEPSAPFLTYMKGGVWAKFVKLNEDN